MSRHDSAAWVNIHGYTTLLWHTSLTWIIINLNDSQFIHMTHNSFISVQELSQKWETFSFQKVMECVHFMTWLVSLGRLCMWCCGVPCTPVCTFTSMRASWSSGFCVCVWASSSSSSPPPSSSSSTTATKRQEKTPYQIPVPTSRKQIHSQSTSLIIVFKKCLRVVWIINQSISDCKTNDNVDNVFQSSALCNHTYTNHPIITLNASNINWNINFCSVLLVISHNTGTVQTQ